MTMKEITAVFSPFKDFFPNGQMCFGGCQSSAVFSPFKDFSATAKCVFGGCQSPVSMTIQMCFWWMSVICFYVNSRTRAEQI